MIKISFSGVSNCGKTSLLTEVKKILSLKEKVASIEEINGKNPFDNDKRSNFISQFFDISSQINEENVQSLAPLDFLLCDGSVLDQWINWKKYISDLEMTPQLEEKNKVLKDLYTFWIKTYDIIFFIRMKLDEKGNRELNGEFKINDLDNLKIYETLFLQTIEDDHLKVVEIWNCSSIDEGAHKIIKTITDFKASKRSVPTT